jgi:hypothetical protein
LQLDRLGHVCKLLFLVLLNNTPQRISLRLLLGRRVGCIDHLGKRFAGRVRIAQRQRLQLADEQLRIDQFFIEGDYALKVGQCELAKLHRSHAALRILRRNIENRTCEQLPSLQQRRNQKLLGKLLVVRIQPFFERGVRVINYFVKIIQRLGCHLKLRGFVEVVLPLVLGDDLGRHDGQYETH